MTHTPTPVERRRLIWKHNSFLGTVAFMNNGLQAILDSETATDESKRLAYQIQGLSYQLTQSLKTRKI